MKPHIVTRMTDGRAMMAAAKSPHSPEFYRFLENGADR
jgi:hypothetical protein